MIEGVLFFILSGLSLLGVVLMMLTRNVIHGAYGLAVVLLAIAGLFVLLNAEYLAIVQIFMYAGGVVVLLVFGIMLVNRNREGIPRTENINLFLATLFCGGLFAFLIKVLVQQRLVWNSGDIVQDQTRTIGQLFITDYLLAFELIAILLLAVLVGAAYLAKKSTDH